jgi:hypothetical protein
MSLIAVASARLMLAAIDLGTISAFILAMGIVSFLLIVLLLLFIARVLGTLIRLLESSRPGKRISAERSGPHPLTNFSRSGVPSDPLNVKVIATPGQLATAFAAAGWYRADEIALITSIRISVDAILRRKYASAPVSSLYLFGRHQDYAFERPGRSVRERDHIRIWDTGERAKDGRPIWIGGATKDIAIELSPTTRLPTHRIADDVDDERAQVIRDLTGSGWVVGQDWEPGWGEPVEMKNAMDDPWHTDGRIALLTLANVPVLAPVAQNVRSPLGGDIARAVGRLLRWRLPKAGRLRARQQRQAERERATVSAKKRDSR